MSAFVSASYSLQVGSLWESHESHSLNRSLATALLHTIHVNSPRTCSDYFTLTKFIYLFYIFIYLFIYLVTHKTLHNMNKRC